MDPLDLSRALESPPSVFDRPESVVEAKGLSDARKAEILRRWEFIAATEQVAVEEGMGGDESDLLRRILIALGKVAGPLDLERTGPTKAHALPRSAISGNDGE